MRAGRAEYLSLTSALPRTSALVLTSALAPTSVRWRTARRMSIREGVASARAAPSLARMRVRMGRHVRVAVQLAS